MYTEVEFTTQYILCRAETKMAIVGSCPQLGLWLPIVAPKSFWVGPGRHSVKVSLQAGSKVMFKWVTLSKDDQVVRWEDGRNKTLIIPSSSTCVRVHVPWNGKPEIIDGQVASSDTGPDDKVASSDTGSDDKVASTDTGSDDKVASSDTGSDDKVASSDTGPDDQVASSDTGPDDASSDTGPDDNVSTGSSDSGVKVRDQQADMVDSDWKPMPETWLSHIDPRITPGAQQQHALLEKDTNPVDPAEEKIPMWTLQMFSHSKFSDLPIGHGKDEVHKAQKQEVASLSDQIQAADSTAQEQSATNKATLSPSLTEQQPVAAPDIPASDKSVLECPADKNQPMWNIDPRIVPGAEAPKQDIQHGANEPEGTGSVPAWISRMFSGRQYDQMPYKSKYDKTWLESANVQRNGSRTSTSSWWNKTRALAAWFTPRVRGQLASTLQTAGGAPVNGTERIPKGKAALEVTADRPKSTELWKIDPRFVPGPDVHRQDMPPVAEDVGATTSVPSLIESMFSSPQYQQMPFVQKYDKTWESADSLSNGKQTTSTSFFWNKTRALAAWCRPRASQKIESDLEEGSPVLVTEQTAPQVTGWWARLRSSLGSNSSIEKSNVCKGLVTATAVAAVSATCAATIYYSTLTSTDDEMTYKDVDTLSQLLNSLGLQEAPCTSADDGAYIRVMRLMGLADPPVCPPTWWEMAVNFFSNLI